MDKCDPGKEMNEHVAAQHRQAELYQLRAQLAIARQALSLVAAPKRADGTYNRSREACKRLAREALAAMDKEQGP